MSSVAHAIEPERVRKTRISGPIKAAIRLMVDEGRSRADAAQACGITDDWLYRALERPDCKMYRNHLMEVLRSSEASRTIARAAKLADGATSEHVKLQANTWLAGIEGIAPTQRIENTHLHLNQQPGLVINYVLGDAARQIDGLAHQVEDARVINGLPQSVPHPSMRNALPGPAKTDGQPAIRDGQRPAPGGAKS